MRNLLRGMLVVICCMAGIAMADEKNILVTSGSDRATPIAVVPFGLQGGAVLPDDMAESLVTICVTRATTRRFQSKT